MRPVFSGDTLRVEVTVRDIDPSGNRRWAWLGLVCRNQHGKHLLLGHVRGFIAQPIADAD